MHWLPTYLRYLGANSHSISLTAIPYIFNSIFGVGKFKLFYVRKLLEIEDQFQLLKQILNLKF